MKKELLNDISPTFCSAKWLQSTIYLHTGNTHSCCFTPIHKIDLDEVLENPSALHNTKLKKMDRKFMKLGRKIPGCEYCWRVEECGTEELSERYHKSLDPEWGLPFLDEVRNLTAEKNYNPKYLELCFDNKCNLKCLYCSPFLSTSWEKEIRQFGPYPTSNSTGNMDKVKSLAVVHNPSDNPFVKAFWKWWPELKNDLIYLRLTGGEPLLDTDTWRVLESVTVEPLPDLSICVNSNLAVPDELINRLIVTLNGIKGKCKNIHIYTSCDAFGAQAEYIRFGLQYEKFLSNIRKIISETSSVDISITITFNLLSLPSFVKLLREILVLKRKFPNRVYFSISMLDHPEYVNVDLAPVGLKQTTGQEVRTFLEQEKHSLTSKEISDLKLLCHRLSHPPISTKMVTFRKLYQSDFAKFITEYDRRKQTDFLQTFPEFAKFFDECLIEASER